MSKKLYYSVNGFYSDYAYSKKDWKEILLEEKNIDSIVIDEQKPDSDVDRWCNAVKEFIGLSGCETIYCNGKNGNPKYEPCNGKNGKCKHLRFGLSSTGKRYELFRSGKMELVK